MKNTFKIFEKNPVAYFCAEYALFEHTPFYAGGLGILAGDYIKEMSEQNFPVVAIGLLYHKEHQHGLELSRERKTPSEIGLNLVKNIDGGVIKIPIYIENRNINIQIWEWKKSKTVMYLLDTQVEENSPLDWNICDTLYDEDRHIRFLQEIVLGVGGMKMLEKLNIEPSLYHLNEGHSAFLSFELIRYAMEKHGLSFEKACEYAKRHIVFTNHTLVSAGQELFDTEKIKSVFPDEFVKLGLNNENKMFSMTTLALNMSRKVNSVSKIHESKARELWKGFDIENVTNGINIERWDLLKFYSHKEQKRKLLSLIKDKCKVSFEEDVLVLGWARRFVDYKRPLAILGDIKRFKELANKTGKKFYLVFSSFVNETYLEENNLMRELNKIIKNDLGDSVVFIPNYDIEIAKLLTSGCDVWLNTPIIGTEACGTSGMKACLNGILPLTTSDGWFDEVDLSNIGWKVEDNDISKNLLDALENEIIPEYYNDRNKWTERMNNARNLILKNFSTERMLDEYVEKLYTPTYLLNKKI